ncbi:hypothetical protein [Fibrobacter sp. HC4]|uniref:hypothetical protein n=1 Tax=Fibrobacter sp. HC4 TaxID=3239812 RepID=UPI000C701AF9|nr:hypothetical protein [Fibrobacter succinogenes]MCL4102005.1 hypothetical protein [Fibrobacter succinogenes]
MQISNNKTFLGLKESIFSNTTKSDVDGIELKLNSEDGDKIKELLELPDETICEMASKMDCLSSAEDGTYELSVCYSQDRKFAALQLAKYMAFKYRPVTGVRFVENETAESLLKILLK